MLPEPLSHTLTGEFREVESRRRACPEARAPALDATARRYRAGWLVPVSTAFGGGAAAASTRFVDGAKNIVVSATSAQTAMLSSSVLVFTSSSFLFLCEVDLVTNVFVFWSFAPPSFRGACVCRGPPGATGVVRQCVRRSPTRLSSRGRGVRLIEQIAHLCSALTLRGECATVAQNA